MLQVEKRLDQASRRGLSVDMSTVADNDFDLPFTALMHRSERGIYGQNNEDGIRDELELLFGIHMPTIPEGSGREKRRQCSARAFDTTQLCNGLGILQTFTLSWLGHQACLICRMVDTVRA